MKPKRGGRALPPLRYGFKPQSTTLQKGTSTLLEAALTAWEKRQGICQITQWDIFKLRRAKKNG